MKYANINSNNGMLLGWYDLDVHDDIPAPNIKVTDEIWQKALSINANCYDGANFIVKDFRTEDEIKDEEIANKIYEAKAYLSSTDWYYPRLTETGKAVPEDIVVKRLAARDLINELEG